MPSLLSAGVGSCVCDSEPLAQLLNPAALSGNCFFDPRPENLLETGSARSASRCRFGDSGRTA